MGMQQRKRNFMQFVVEAVSRHKRRNFLSRMIDSNYFQLIESFMNTSNSRSRENIFSIKSSWSRTLISHVSSPKLHCCLIRERNAWLISNIVAFELQTKFWCEASQISPRYFVALALMSNVIAIDSYLISFP